MSDLVAIWNVPLSDNNYRIEFEHGTISGKRVIRVNEKEIFRKDWMFKLVGSEQFEIGPNRVRCEININTCGTSGLNYEYSLKVNGKQLQRFKETQKNNLISWMIVKNGNKYRVVLDRQQMNVWVNGRAQEVENVFVENGTEIRFQLKILKDENNNEICDQNKNLLFSLKKSNDETIQTKEEKSNIFDELRFKSQSLYADVRIRILSSGNKREGIIYSLEVDGDSIEEIKDI